jgi:hypothetical protein
MTRERSMHLAKLPDDRATLLTPGDIPVRTDVFIHNLDAFTLEALRRALAQGLMPFDLDFVDDGIVILRLARPRF